MCQHVISPIRCKLLLKNWENNSPIGSACFIFEEYEQTIKYFSKSIWYGAGAGRESPASGFYKKWKCPSSLVFENDQWRFHRLDNELGRNALSILSACQSIRQLDMEKFRRNAQGKWNTDRMTNDGGMSITASVAAAVGPVHRKRRLFCAHLQNGCLTRAFFVLRTIFEILFGWCTST